ncbi:MAG: guanylate kinase [Culturomica sp.]|jgi:guanylate kinase|nr:guanylate kinase [Culturomica sp.]
MHKVVIFSAPSGAGKSTIVRHLLRQVPELAFSISATSRPPRGREQDGKEYYFLSETAFQEQIDRGAFLEWEEVYPGCRYGTLRSEVERIWAEGKSVLFDIDVIGGLNLKKIFGDRALAVFIEPPSVETLHRRLIKRGTDSPEKICERIDKAKYEMSFADRFDTIVLNDRLEDALADAEEKVAKFLSV